MKGTRGVGFCLGVGFGGYCLRRAAEFYAESLFMIRRVRAEFLGKANEQYENERERTNSMSLLRIIFD